MLRKVMDIKEFVAQYHNHPVLFVGTGFSLRYLNNSYTWDNLLKKIALDIFESEETYSDIKLKYIDANNNCDFCAVAEELEKCFDQVAKKERVGKFKEINDIYYENASKNKKLSRFKLYISSLLKDFKYKESEDIDKELKTLSTAKKNISSVITTNYDQLLEELLEFTPIIGNDIVLTNPYGSIYKVHGCVTDSNSIIITSSDYEKFNEKYSFIKAQLLSLFIHNPIIFIGYSIGDDNIKNILKTIFSNISNNDEIAKKIRNNFLLVEHEKNSSSRDVIEHDIDLPINGSSTTIRINKIKTNNFLNIYQEISNLTLPISVMDVRKVQSILKKIVEGDAAELCVKFSEDFDKEDNSNMVIAIHKKTDDLETKTIVNNISSQRHFIQNYFDIIDNKKFNDIGWLDGKDVFINHKHYFPIFGFNQVNKELNKFNEISENQLKKLKHKLAAIKTNNKLKNKRYTTIKGILKDQNISKSYKYDAIFYYVNNSQIDIDQLECYLKDNIGDETITEHRMLLCLYDFLKYSSQKTL